MRAVVVCLFLLIFGASSPALAMMKYCNNFKYDIHIALVFETKDGFVSEGWTGIKANSCWEDNDIVSPFTFYYHAETDAIPTGDSNKTWSWGDRRAFCVLNETFKITHAEFKTKGGRFTEFNGPYTLGAKNGQAAITFGDGTSSVSLSVK